MMLSRMARLSEEITETPNLFPYIVLVSTSPLVTFLKSVPL